MTRWKPPQKAKRDLNEPDIIAELLAHGLSVEPTDKPAVKYLVGLQPRGFCFMTNTPPNP